MDRKKIIIGGTVILGMGIGILLGLQQIEKTKITSAEEECSQCQNGIVMSQPTKISEPTQVEPIIIPFDYCGTTEYCEKVISLEIEKFKSKGIKVERKDVILEDGTKIAFLLPEGSVSSFEALKEKTVREIREQKALTQKDEQKYGRSEEERSIVAKKIKEMFEGNEVIYKGVTVTESRVLEKYQDNRGYIYKVNPETNQIIYKGVGISDNISRFQQAHKDILDENYDFKSSPKISVKEAEEIANNFIERYIGDTDKLAKEYGYNNNEGKGGTYIFSWGEKVQLILIPVNGEILQYSLKE